MYVCVSEMMQKKMVELRTVCTCACVLWREREMSRIKYGSSDEIVELKTMCAWIPLSN